MPLADLDVLTPAAPSRPTLRPSAVAPALTVVVLTLNEALRLERCLQAIPGRYPVLVLDSGSTDRTLEVAAEHGCRTRSHAWSGFAGQRNFALRHCAIASEWVLFIDADEIYEPAFFAWFERQILGRADVDVVLVPSVVVFKGVRLRRAPGYPIYHPRLVRRGHARFVPNHTGHGETVRAGARLIRAEVGYEHRLFEGDVTGWMTKHVGLAAREAHLLTTGGKLLTQRARLSRRLGGSLVRLPARFFYHYVARAGFLDGRAGLEYALLYAWFEATKWVMRKLGLPGEPA